MWPYKQFSPSRQVALPGLGSAVLPLFLICMVSIFECRAHIYKPLAYKANSSVCGINRAFTNRAVSHGNTCDARFSPPIDNREYYLWSPLPLPSLHIASVSEASLCLIQVSCSNRYLHGRAK